MKYKAAIFASALLMAAPAWAQHGGGHGGFSGGRGSGLLGSRGGGSTGGHGAAAPRGVAPAHVAAPRMVAAPQVMSAPRATNSGFTASQFVSPLNTPTRSGIRHLPIGTLATRRAPPATPWRVSVTWTTTTAHMMTAATPTRLAVGGAPTQLARPSDAAPVSVFPLRNRAFFGGSVFFRRSAVFIFIGDGFFFPFFPETVTRDPFLVNPFCPFCATGRILKLNGPFARQAFFFDEFSPRRFFPAFGSGFGAGVFLDGVPITMAEQPPAEEKPSEVGMPAEEAAPPAPAVKQPAARPITLLVLKNGWMYGLADYWVEGGRLHYITTYGGENSVPLEQIDFDKTIHLNGDRGVEFVLRAKPQSR